MKLNRKDYNASIPELAKAVERLYIKAEETVDTTDIKAHMEDFGNPHHVTAEQLGIASTEVLEEITNTELEALLK